MKRAASILVASVLFLAGAAPLRVRAGEPPAATRVLRVKAVADEAFREKKKWEKEIRAHIQWADREFRKFAGVGLELVTIERWTTHESRSMPLLLDELRVKVEKGEADIVVGFTGHEVPVLQLIRTGAPDWHDPDNLGAPSDVRIRLPSTLGIALPLSDRCVLRRGEGKRETRHTLLHEIAHLFGGLHVKEKSILYTWAGPNNFVLDPFNRRVFELMRERDFNQGIRGLSPEKLTQLVALYRERPLRDERDSDTNIRIGYLLMAAGQVEAALEEFRVAIDINPREAFAVLRGAIIPELEAVAEEEGLTPLTRYTLGSAYYTVRNWHQAGRHLIPNCIAEPPHAASCSVLGATFFQAKDIKQAERALLRALEYDESLVNAHNTLGSVYGVMNRTSDALAHFNRAAELEPDNTQVQYNMGLAYLKLDLLEPAADAFRRVLELKPKQEMARIKLALALARLGETKEARQRVRDFEKKKQLSAYIIRDMAEIYFRDGDKKKAWKFLGFAKKGGLNVTELEQEMLAGAAKPRRVKTGDLLQQAEAYYDSDRYHKAYALLEQARRQKPKKVEVHYWLGRVAAAQDKPAEAAEHLQQALALKEKFPYTHFELGQLAFDRKDYAAAINHLDRYLELDDFPYSRAYFLLGTSHFQLGDITAAEENLKKAIQRHSGYGDAFYMLAAVYAQQERKQEAIAELKLALETSSLRSSYRPEAHYNLAVLCYETGNHELAWKHARIARRLHYRNVDWLLQELASAEDDSSPREE
ncbi:MAG: tetratricopeptide repeat protein [Terriglobia bacterium]